MSKKNLAGLTLEKAFASKLRELLGEIAWLSHWSVEHVSARADAGFDLLARLPLPGGKVALCVECKSDLRPSAFQALTQRNLSPPGRPRAIVRVLAMPFVSSRMADLCRQHGWSWYDLAGNCHIDVPDVIYIERSGYGPVHRLPRPTANLSTPEAGRVIRVLLAPENAGVRWTQRSMAVNSGVARIEIPRPSLGLVNKVVRHLRDEAFIETFPDGGFRLRDPIKLLFAWRDAYRFDRHERRSYFTLAQGEKVREALHKLDLEAGGLAVYAAFSAADFQAPHVRQPKTWLYVHRDYLPHFESLMEAKEVESGENIVVLVPDDNGVFYMADGGAGGEERMGCTNPVQTYIDLSYCGGRGEEAAEALLAQKLKPEWKGRGFQ